ncbi:MAG: Uma2 family endonuclease [Isosphaeraceae bacterium]
MSTTVIDEPTTAIEPAEQVLTLRGIGWDAYLTINEALGERQQARLVYLDGKLTLMTKSRRHEWLSNRFFQLVVAVAQGMGMTCEDAGETTFRREDIKGGLEGDQTFYFGEHAEMMRGPVDIDLTTQPPPDLAIEVEVSHRADHAIAVYARLGVPEVWRFDADSERCAILILNESGFYTETVQSRCLTPLTSNDIVEQMKIAQRLGWNDWSLGLPAWVRDVLAPRARGGA